MSDVKQTMKEIVARLGSIDNSLAELKGRVAGIEHRFTGVEHRVAALPTTWTILTITFATWGIGSGILIFALNVLRQ